MSDQPVIRARELTRYFGAEIAVYDLNLEVPRGCVFAFLGRNGSGKTTTIRMLLGLLPPDARGRRVLGCDIRALNAANPLAHRISDRGAPALRLDDRA